MKLAALLVLTMTAVTSALSQAPATTPTSNPVVGTIRDLEQRQSKNLIAAAEEMPADKYSYKPTPEQITFAHLIMHTASSNNGLCSKIAGEKRDVQLKDTDPKDTLTKALRDSFTYCEQVLQKATDANLSEPMEVFPGRNGTRATVFISMATGWADHYGAAAMYLRLNGLLPPSATKH